MESDKTQDQKDQRPESQFKIDYPNRIVRIQEVQVLTGLKKSAIYKLINNGRFPLPRKITSYANGWMLAEIFQWMEDLPTADLLRTEDS